LFAFLLSEFKVIFVALTSIATVHRFFSLRIISLWKYLSNSTTLNLSETKHRSKYITTTKQSNTLGGKMEIYSDRIPQDNSVSHGNGRQNHDDDDDENDNTWETMKENAAPLERGRNVKDLKRTFGDASVADGGGEEAQRRIERSKKHFEKMIAPAEKSAEQGTLS
jgi:hypothetical protein